MEGGTRWDLLTGRRIRMVLVFTTAATVFPTIFDREVQKMEYRGCQEGKATPKLVEVECPSCGEIMEVFIYMGGSDKLTGRTTADEACPACGKSIPEGTPIGTLKLA